MSTVAPRPEPLLLQAADESHSLSIFLSGLLVHRTCARSHVPHWNPVGRVVPGQNTNWLKGTYES